MSSDEIPARSSALRKTSGSATLSDWLQVDGLGFFRFLDLRTLGACNMAKDPSMPFYVNDWLSSPSVACMTLEQQGAYLRLLCYCWASQEAAIPDDDKALAVLSGMNEGWFNGGSHLVRVCFIPHPIKTGYLTNRRLQALWLERLAWREKSRDGGKKSAKARRKSLDTKELRNEKMVEPPFNHPLTTVEPPLQPNGNSSSSSSSSSLSSYSSSSSCEAPPLKPPRKKRTPSAALGYTPEFERFWLAYPAQGRSCKGTAFKAFERALKLASLETLLDAAQKYSSSGIVQRGIAKHAATWLNGRCWEDDPAALESGDFQQRTNHDPRGTLSVVQQWIADKTAQQGGS